MDLALVHHALEAAYAEVLRDPRNQTEALDGAACGPHMQHLAILAAGNSVPKECPPPTGVQSFLTRQVPMPRQPLTRPRSACAIPGCGPGIREDAAYDTSVGGSTACSTTSPSGLRRRR